MREKIQKALKKILGVLVFISYPIFFIIIAGLSIGLYIQTRELNSIRDLYETAEENLNRGQKQNQLTIENLEESFKELNEENNNLKSEISDLEAELQDAISTGYAEIEGEILPFILDESSFAQYQLVCAENIDNLDQKYCISVSPTKKEFTIILPEADYNVFALIEGNTELSGYKAYYTEYAKCIEEKGENDCDKEALSKRVTVQAELNKKVSGVNPIHWKKTN